MNVLDHPYRDLTGGQWLRGNLHTHTTNSDGQYSPQEIVEKYAKLGYDFLLISDHDWYTSYEDYAKLNSNGMILVPGNEISDKGSHVVHVNADRKIDPSPQRQDSITAVNATSGFVILAHPNWLNLFNHTPRITSIQHTTTEQMREWVGYLGIEVYNGLISFEEGSPYATDKWDIMLSEGRRVWGFANDDTHCSNTVGLGWNVAYVRDPTIDGVVDALRTGRFYASTGVKINNIEVEGMRIKIETENAERIVASKQWGIRVAASDDCAIEIEVSADAWYVRFECWGKAEQFAWTQPFFVR